MNDSADAVYASVGVGCTTTNASCSAYAASMLRAILVHAAASLPAASSGSYSTTL